MIKCTVPDSCPKGKECCCSNCDESSNCKSRCELSPDLCKSADVQESTNLEVFQSKAAATIQVISDIVTAKKELENREKCMKEQLQQTMEQYGVKSFDTDTIKMTYIEASTRNSIDSAKLKKKHPDIAAECTKSSSVKPFVKIEVK